MPLPWQHASRCFHERSVGLACHSAHFSLIYSSLVTRLLLFCSGVPLTPFLGRDAAFLTNVKHEVQQQLLRLGSHASLVVFGGNNEVEQALEW